MVLYMNLYRSKLVKKIYLAGLLMASNQVMASDDCQFGGLVNQSDWVERVSLASDDCYKSWFNAPKGTALSLYSESSLKNIVLELDKSIVSYRGEESEAKRIHNLSEFIRAAYYVRYNNRSEFGSFSKDFSVMVAHIADRFIGSDNAKLLGAEQANAMYSVTLLVDNIRQLPITMDSMLTLLESINPENSQSYEFIWGVNNLFVAMFGHIYLDEFYEDLLLHPEYLERLENFVHDNLWLMGTEAEMLLHHAVREMGRLLASDKEAINQSVVRFLKKVMRDHGLDGEQRKLWVAAAEMLLHYEPEIAESLDIPNQKIVLEQNLFVHRYQCEGPAVIRSQNLTKEQEVEACETLREAENEFHSLVKSGQVPVEDDYNSELEVVVWKDKSSYSTFSHFLFGNSTNNGGQYFEGDPTKTDNTARFLAYRTDSDTLSILNLEHEYVHYLDGRFNLYGDFRQTMAKGNIVWWLEGFAEYAHYKDKNQGAIRAIGKDNYSLSEVLATSYDDDANRVYRWGYLAVRFLFEKHPTEIEQLLGYARKGEYSTWSKEVQRLGSDYDQEFTLWIKSLANDKGQEPESEERPNSDKITEMSLNSSATYSAKKYQEHLFYIDVPDRVTEFKVSIKGDGDADLYASYDRVAHYFDYETADYKIGASNEAIIFEPQDNGFVVPGRYYFSLTGRDSFQKVIVSSVAEIEAIEDSSQNYPTVLENGQTEVITVDGVYYVGLYVDEPGSVNVSVKPVDDKHGNIDLYIGLDAWASKENFDIPACDILDYKYVNFEVSKPGYVYFTFDSVTDSRKFELTISH